MGELHLMCMALIGMFMLTHVKAARRNDFNDIDPLGDISIPYTKITYR